MPNPTAGVTHDVTFQIGSEVYGFLVEDATYVEEKANDFAPTIGVGDDPKFAEGAYRSWSQSGATEGVDGQFFDSAQKILWTDGNVDTSRDKLIQLSSAWASSDANQIATAPMIIDFSTNRVACGVGTKVRRLDTSALTWSASTTTLGANVTYLFVYNTNCFAACGSGADFYRSSDLDTWTQPAAGQKASCFANYAEKLWLGYQGGIKSSTDNGATWGAVINVGDPNTNITNFAVFSGVLLIRKEDGLYYYNGTTVTEIYKNRNALYAGNKTLLYHSDGFLYMNELGAIKKFSISSGALANMTDITPLMLGSATKELYGHGTPIAMWSGSQYLYMAFDDGESVYPEVMYYNGLGWHQFYRGTSGDAMNAGGYSQLLGWHLINDGATRRKKMSTLKDIPLADYSTTETGTAQTSFFDASLPAMPKGFASVRMWAEGVSDTKTITVSYRKTSADSWTQIGIVNALTYPAPFTIPFNTSLKAISAEAIQLQFVFATDSATATPILKRFDVRYINRPEGVHAYSMALNLLDNQQLLDGTAETVSVQERLDFLRKIEDSTVPIVFTDRQQRKHLVFDTKITLQRPLNRQDLKEEPRVSMVFIDADEGLWIQERLTISFAIALTTALTSQTTFVWSPNATNTFNWNYGQWM